MFICSVACAETPDFVLEQASDSHSGHDHGDGGSNVDNGGQSGELSGSNVVSTQAYEFSGLCGEGFVTSSFKETKIYIGKKSSDDLALNEQEFLIRVEYSAPDGDALNDGRLKFYYENGTDLTPVASPFKKTSNTKIVLTGLVIEGEDDLIDQSLLTDILNAADENLTNSYKSYYKVYLNNDFDFSMKGTDLNINDLLVGSLESIIVAGVGHYHFPKCVDVTFKDIVEDFDFKL